MDKTEILASNTPPIKKKYDPSVNLMRGRVFLFI